MNKALAKIFSYIFHPLLLPVYAVILFFIFPSYLSHYQYEYKRIIVLIIFLMTFIFPVLILLVLLNIKTISNLNLSKRTERRYPYAIVSIVYITAYYILINFPAGIPNPISNFILIAAIIIFIVMLINFKMKISAHMAGIGGFIGYFYIFLLKENTGYVLFSLIGVNITVAYFLMLLLLIAAITATARLSLNAHNPQQILVGFLIGFPVGISVIFFN